MASVQSLSARRAKLMSELESLEVELRAAVVSDVAGGRAVSVVAREAGVTRPTVYKWVRDAVTPSDDAARLVEIDARYERLVDLLVQAHKPADGISRKGKRWSGLQMEQAARNVSRKGGSATKALRETCESLLLRLDGSAVDLDLIRQCAQEAGFDAQGGDVIPVLLAELDEAYALRKRIQALEDPFFSDV